MKLLLALALLAVPLLALFRRKRDTKCLPCADDFEWKLEPDPYWASMYERNGA